MDRVVDVTDVDSIRQAVADVVIDVNLLGVYRTIHATLPYVIESRGYVLVIASIASFMALPGMSSYSASKAGVESLTRALRAEVGFRGVAAGSAHPSWIDTDLVREREADLESFRTMRKDDRRRHRKAEGKDLRPACSSADLLASQPAQHEADRARHREGGIGSGARDGT